MYLHVYIQNHALKKKHVLKKKKLVIQHACDTSIQRRTGVCVAKCHIHSQTSIPSFNTKLYTTNANTLAQSLYRCLLLVTPRVNMTCANKVNSKQKRAGLTAQCGWRQA